MTQTEAVTVRKQVVVDAPIERAFSVFTDRFGDFKPPEHNLLGAPIAETVFEGRLQRDPAGVAGLPAGRGVRRADARAGAHRLLGLRARRAAQTPTADRREVPGHPPGARVTPPARTTPRSTRSGTLLQVKQTPASS